MTVTLSHCSAVIEIRSAFDPENKTRPKVVAQFDREESQTRDDCVAKYATHRAARPDPSLRKGRLLGMTVALSHYPAQRSNHSNIIYNNCVK